MQLGCEYGMGACVGACVVSWRRGQQVASRLECHRCRRGRRCCRARRWQRSRRCLQPGDTGRSCGAPRGSSLLLKWRLRSGDAPAARYAPRFTDGGISSAGIGPGSTAALALVSLQLERRRRAHLDRRWPRLEETHGRHEQQERIRGASSSRSSRTCGCCCGHPSRSPPHLLLLASAGS